MKVAVAPAVKPTDPGYYVGAPDMSKRLSPAAAVVQGVLREGLGMNRMICEMRVPDLTNPPPDQFSSLAEEALWKESVLRANRLQCG